MKYLMILLIVVSCLYGDELIIPIPQTIKHNPAKAALGKQLFSDPILSKDKTISCASCHDFKLGGADGMKISTGIKGLKGNINAPTVFNSVFNFTQFWNGRAKNLSEQASGPLHNPVEMGMDSKIVIQRLSASDKYRESFWMATGKKTITFKDVIDVIAEYEKTLITPNSKFDRFLRHEISLSPKELRGYEHFKNLGCIECHNGVNMGGNLFQKFGAIVHMPHDIHIADRYAITHRPQDKNVFKVPTLRNIALTAPYFHDGRALTLADAVKTMGYSNLGVELSPDERLDIVAFFNTLTGTLPK